MTLERGRDPFRPSVGPELAEGPESRSLDYRRLASAYARDERGVSARPEPTGVA
jgi:hypothetical protein